MGNYPRLVDETDARQADDDHLHGIPRLYGTAPTVEHCPTHGPYPARLMDECPLCLGREEATRRFRWRRNAEDRD